MTDLAWTLHVLLETKNKPSHVGQELSVIIHAGKRKID